MSNGKKLTKRRIKKRIMTAFEWKTFFVWRVTYICVHVTQAQFLPTSSKHVSPGMRFLGLGIGGLSHQSCMSLHIGTNNIVGGSINIVDHYSHYNDVIMSAMAFQITGISIACSTVCAGTDQRKPQSLASLAFARGIHRWSVDSAHNGPVTRKMFPFDAVIMVAGYDVDHGWKIFSFVLDEN